MRLTDQYMMIASCKAHEGKIMIFLKDLWDLGILQLRFAQ
jgi:hypothetical protein